VYERVLIPLDGSEPAEAVLPFAERVAGPLDAEICLLRVVEPVTAIPRLGTGEGVGPDVLLLWRLEAERYLAGVAQRLASRGLRVRRLVRLGVPELEILAVAKAEKADLIAMTTHGRRGFQRVVFGSVATEVLRNAAVPVLMIRMTAAAPAPTEVVER
jgi:nucleotide-binding universal stress UspA family protein